MDRGELIGFGGMRSRYYMYNCYVCLDVGFKRIKKIKRDLIRFSIESKQVFRGLNIESCFHGLAH